MSEIEESRGGPARSDPVVAEPVARRRVSSAVHEVCPYLLAEPGGWRSAYAAREHRCGALVPPARLAIAKQRALCLLPVHATCPTFLAAESSDERPARASADGPELWPATRSTPVVLEPTRGLLAPLGGSPARTGGQALLIALMALAFLVLIVARTTAPSAPGSDAPGASASAGALVPSLSPSVPATASLPTATPGPSATASGSPVSSPAATPAASPTPRPSGQQYTVQNGDTLSAIAAKFGTTVKAIAEANGITDVRVIHVGQVLIIP